MTIDHLRDAESRSAEIHIVLSLGRALSTIAVTLRPYARLLHIRIMGHDAVMAAAQRRRSSRVEFNGRTDQFQPRVRIVRLPCRSRGAWNLPHRPRWP